MKSPLHKLLILCCALYLSGAHWMLLQTSAWTGMLLARSVNTSVAEAFESTFDGNHPCALCSAIAGGKQTEERSQKELQLLKKTGDLKFLKWSEPAILETQVGESVTWPSFLFSVATRVEVPPTPPPLA